MSQNLNQGAAASTNDFVTLSIGDVSNSSSKNLDKNLKISTLGVIGISDSYFSGVSFPSTATIGGTSQNVNAIYDPIFFKIEANGNSFSARDVDNTRAGTQIRFYFDMPDGGQNFDTYMKWNGVDEQWYEFKADGNLATYDDGAEFIDSDGDGDYDRVVLTITEGDKLGGDADGSADNIIIDPGTIVSTSGLNYTGALSFNILEGNTDVAMLTTTGANSYTLQTPTGYDHGLFTLNSTNGTLSFTNAPDYENPQDVFGTAGDNIYMVQVLISDGSNSTVIDVEVNVLDRYEFGQNNCPTLINKNPGGQLNNSWSYASSFTGITTTVNATGYIEFEFGDIPAQEGLPKIVAAFVDGVRDNLVEFDDPKVYVGSKSADQYVNSGLTRYVWHAQPSNNFSSANTFQLLFDNGGLLNINDLNSACGYSSASGTPLNSISFTEGYVSSNSECEGSNISFDITTATATNGGTITYQWQKLNTTTGVFDDLSGKTSASLSIASVVSSDAGTYRCSIKEIDGSSATIMAALSTEAQLSVTAGPTINFASLTLCAGATSNLSVTSNNTTGDSWGSSDPTVATVNSSGQVTGVNAGTATITYTDGDGCSTTSSITVPASPSAVLDDNTPSVCSTSATYELDLSSIIGSPDEYQIDYSSGLLTDVGLTSFTGSTLTLNVPTSASGSYSATLYLKNTSSNCESSAIPFTLNIDALPNDGLAVSDATICDGSSANIIVGSSENGYSYQLRNNADDSNQGAAINGNGGDITFNVSPNSTTSYNVLVTNGTCSVELTDISTVTVDALSVGGTLDDDGSGTGAAGATVVAGTNSTTIYLSGHTGSVVRWESSSDNTFSTFTQIANTATTYTATNVNATTYYRALVQNGSCNPDYSTTFTLSTLSQPTVTFASTTPSACEGDAGTLTISSKSAGADQYRIDWDATAELAGFNDVPLTLIPGTNTISLAANNTAASYNATVYVKNSSNGQESTGTSITYTVNASPTITGTTSVCMGSSTTLNGSGTPAGVDPWISANTSVATINSSGDITPVGAGSSVITYTDNNGCSTSTTVTVNALPTTTITSSDLDNTICDGESITLTSDQSGAGYTYKWFKDGSVIPGETSSTYSATVSGSYTVEVTNSGTSCSATTAGANAIAVVVNSNPAIALSSSTNIACFGESTGAINISVSGGDGNFTFAWSDGASYSATSEDISNVFPGAYSVTVTDGNSCSANTSYNITQPASALSATTSSTNVSSSGGSDGSATVTPSGGTAGYTYLWTDGQTNATATNLAAGNYSVTIKDANLCSITKNFTITEPSSLSATTTVINNVSCNNGTDGFASVSVTGGTSPYTYSWNTTPVQTNSTATNLAAGTYTVTVTDFTNVVTTANVTISEPSALSLSITATDVSCVDDVTGALDATVTGGTPNYTFAWSNSSSSEDQTGLGTGTYSLTVTDDNGCQVSSSATISVLDNIAPTVTTQDITVQMDALGGATITAAMINDGSTDNCAISSLSLDITSFDCDDLGPNTVVLNVTDNNGNSATGTATVTVVDTIDPTITAPAAVTVNVDADACSTALSNVTLGTPTTGDNCSVATTTNDAPVSFPLGATTVTWTVTDGSGNTATSTQVVTVVDNIDPTITAPAAVTVNVDAGACSTALSNVTLGAATTSDNCSVASTTNDAPSSFPLGNTTVTWTVTDGAGNTTTATQVVTVIDNIDPTITCPSDITAYADATTNGTAVTWSPAIASDNCTIVSLTSDIASGSTFTLGATMVTYTATDQSGNFVTCTFTVTVLDTVSPVITSCPADITQDNDAGNCSAVVTWTAPTFFDNSGSYTTVWSHSSGDVFAVGTTTVTATVTDAAGNSTVCSFDVTVEDNEAPTITAPADVTVNVDAGVCSTALSNVTLGAATTSDNCSVATTTNDAPVSFPLGATAVTWTVTDGSGNTATSTQVVTVVDNIAPVAVAQNITVQLDANGQATITTADVDNGSSDNCTFTLSLDQTSFDCDDLGANTVTLTATDGSSNTHSVTATVTVEDNIDPVAVAQNITVQLDANGQATITTADVDNGSSDNCTFTLSLDQTSFDCDDLGANTVTLTATDGSSNTHSVTATVTVVDNIDPVAVAQDITVFLDANGQASITTADVDNGSSDNCTFTLGLDITSFDCDDLGANTVTLTATDGSSNDHSATATVTVVDNIDPVAVAQDITVFLDANGQASITTADVDNGSSDNCTFTLGLDITSFDCDDLGANTVTLTATDGSNNDHSATATVTVVDNIDPVAVAQDITVFLDANGQASITTADVDNGSSDNCTFTLGLDITSFDCDDLGANTVTLTATDGSNNDHSATATVTVVDNIDPVAVAQDITVFLDANGQASITTADVDNGSSDNCTFTLSLDKMSFDCTNLGANTVTLTATDGSNNDNSATATVTVVDNIDPTITAPAAVTVNVDAGACSTALSNVTLGTPTTGDNCSVATTTNDAPVSFPLGATTVTWTVTDGAGNTTTTTQVVTVIDNIDPVLTCPNDLTVYGVADSTLTSVSWSAATATDNCSIDTIYSDIQTGHYFPLGITTVTYVAIDGSGNSDTCSFSITVVDTVSPVITGCPSPITQNNDTDSCGAVVNWTAPTYYDNSDYYTVSASHASGDYFPVGTTTVTITVADSSGNSSACAFDVTVEDAQVPYVVPFSNVAVTLGTDGMYNLAVATVDSASYDNCGIANRYLSDTFFNCNDVPAATTWLVVEDIHGNKDSALVTIQVSLPSTPVLTTVATVSDVLCHGDSTGFIQVAVSGGVAPYAYNWSSGSNVFEAINLPIGSYWFEVTDTNGCYTSDTLVMNEPAPLAVSTVKSIYTGGYNVSINGTSDGSITTTASGGITPYTFDWNTGAFTTQDLTGISAGIYSLVMTDSNGCTIAVVDTLIEPKPLVINASSLQSVVCPDDTAGIALAVASGAVPPYQLTWDFGSTVDYVTGLSYGIYTVTATDTNGAVASDTVLIDALDYDCDGIYNVDEGGSPNGGGGLGDIDGDGIPNQEDEDSDGDGLPDDQEFDYDNDGVGFDDCDGDGIPNFLDPDLCELLVPAVFTPNDDGDNDYWEILGIMAFPDNNVKIFNRWGELVYSKEGYNNEFNGRANTRTQMNGGDGLLPTGTYYYVVKVYETGDIYTGYVYITK